MGYLDQLTETALTPLTTVRRAFTSVFDRVQPLVAGRMLGGLFPAGTGPPPRRGTREFLQAYATMPWLRATSTKVANEIATLEWQIYAPRRRTPMSKVEKRPDLFRTRKRWRKAVDTHEVEVLEHHPLIEFLDRPCPFLTGVEVAKITQLYEDIVGEAYWLLERSNNKFRIPVAGWPVPPSWVMALPVPTLREYRLSFGAWQVTVPEENLFRFVDPALDNPYARGVGVAQSLADELQTDEFTAKHILQFFFGRARPDLVVTLDDSTAQDFDDDEIVRFERDWLNKNQGLWRAWKPYFINRKVQITQLEQDFRSLQMVQLREYERDTIIQCYGGIPPEIMGIIANSNRATIDAASYLFDKYCVDPRANIKRARLQEFLVPQYDDRLILDYVPIVQEDKEFKRSLMVSMPWAFQVNEVRELAGEEPLDKGGELHATAGMTFKETLEEEAPPPPPPLGPFGGPPPPSLPSDDTGKPPPKENPVAQARRPGGEEADDTTDEKKALAKYSEDQARDDQGQWTDGGGGESGSSEPVPAPSAPSAPTQPTDVGSRIAHRASGLPEKQAARVQLSEARFGPDKVENISAVTAEGKKLGGGSGTKMSVVLGKSTIEAISKEPPHTVVVTHNHPDGSSFSYDDVVLAAQVRLKEMRIVAARDRKTYGPDRAHGVTYRVALPSGAKGWPPAKEIKAAYEKHGKALAGKFPKDEKGSQEWSHATNEAAAKTLGLKYSRTFERRA